MSIVKKTNSNHSLSSDVFSSFWDPFEIPWNSISLNSQVPIHFFNFQRDGDDLVISCDIPGVKLEDVQLEIEGNQLRVNALRKGNTESKYVQSTLIPKEYDTETSEATLEYGVLSIRLKKMASAKAKKVSIKEKR